MRSEICEAFISPLIRQLEIKLQVVGQCSSGTELSIDFTCMQACECTQRWRKREVIILTIARFSDGAGEEQDRDSAIITEHMRSREREDHFRQKGTR